MFSARSMKYFSAFAFLLVTVIGHAQTAEIIKLDKLKEIINGKTGKIQVINFWATWCGPCVKELPLLEKLTAQNRTDIQVVLVSMDLDLDPNPEKVYKFIDRKQIKSRVVILNEKDPNAWIDKISSDWSGALPATLVVNSVTGKRKFIEKELKDGDLEKIISEVQ
jgi:thiol-disulfide isomerase/thioredoxin